MYGYGNSGNFWGAAIGIIIGIVIVFLICRELVCWYWKINKIASLLEDQNKILMQLLKNMGVSKSYSGDNLNNEPSEPNEVNVSSINKSLEGMYVTINTIPLKEDSNGDRTKCILSEGAKLKYLGDGNSVTENNVTALMYYVETEDGKKGYCFSKYLKKI